MAGLPTVQIPSRSGSGSVSGISDVPGLQNALDDKVDDPLSATDIPTGVDATKLADGSVTNTELQYINTLSSNAQTQLNGKQAAATGTPDGTKYLRDDNSWQAVIASDATKLPLAGGTLTGALLFSGTQTSGGSSIANIFRDASGSINYNVNTGASHAFSVGGTIFHQLYNYGLDFSANGLTPAGTKTAIYRDSSASLCLNAPAGSTTAIFNAGTISAQFGAQTGGTGHFLKQNSAGGVITSSALSATEIRTAWNATTAGTATALTATIAGISALADGLAICVELHLANGTAATLNLNGLGAKNLYKVSQVGITTLSTGQLPQYSRAILFYSAALDVWLVEGIKLLIADMPFTGTPTSAKFPDGSGAWRALAFGDITGWPGASTDFIRGDGTDGPLSATEILAALASGKWPIFTLASVGGTANAITATFGETLASGQFFWLVPTSTSSSTTVNLNVDSVGNKRIKQQDGSTDPAVGDVVTGKFTLLYYDGTVFRQILGAPVSATDSTKLPLSGGTGSPMTGPIVMSNTTAPAGSENYLCAVSGYAVVNGASGRLRAVGANILSWEPGGITAHLGGVFNAALQFATTQTSPGASITNVYRSSAGDWIQNVPTGAGHGFNINNVSQATISVAGLFFQNAHTLNTGYIGVCRLSNSLYLTAGTGNAIAATVNGNVQVHMSENGIQLPTAHTGPANTVYGFWRESVSSGAIVQGPISGYACLYSPGASISGTALKAHGSSDASRPASFTLRSEGKAFTNNGTWTNFYSLAEGTHNGQFRIYCSLTGGYFQFSITGTTLLEVYDGWTVTSGTTVTGDLTASTGVIAFRVSAGILQINVGTSVSGSGYFHAQFEGNVRP